MCNLCINGCVNVWRTICPSGPLQDGSVTRPQGRWVIRLKAIFQTTCTTRRPRESKELRVDIVEKVPQSVLASDLKIYERSVRKTFIASMKFLPSCLTIQVLVPLAQGSYYNQEAFAFLFGYMNIHVLCLRLLLEPRTVFFFSLRFSLAYSFLLRLSLTYFSVGEIPSALVWQVWGKRLFLVEDFGCEHKKKREKQIKENVESPFELEG